MVVKHVNAYAFLISVSLLCNNSILDAAVYKMLGKLFIKDSTM